MMKYLICSGLLVALLTGCAGPSTRYAWNDYDEKLYRHYKNPADYEEFIEHLRETIKAGEATGKVPPGIYAEYGFAMYEKKQFQEAEKYFTLEKSKWPESSLFMTKMLKNAQMGGGKRDKKKEGTGTSAGLKGE